LSLGRLVALALLDSYRFKKTLFYLSFETLKNEKTTYGTIEPCSLGGSILSGTSGN